VLEGAGSDRGTQALTKVLFNRKLAGFMRSLAVSSLGVRLGDRVTRSVIKACEDPDPIVRAAAVRALGNRPHGGDKKVMKALVRAAEDQDATVRLEALLGLGMSRNELGGAALTAALTDTEQPVRRVAADGLRFVVHRPSVQPLIQALNTRDAVMRRTCAEALVRQTGKDLGEDYALWREWYANR
jgi:HEAT repeat protein